MSKIEWNPRKKLHIDFMHSIIMELHNEIFQESFEIIQSSNVTQKYLHTRRKELRIKIELYKKYSRRLKILEL
jgi:hypothetical protein